MSSSSSSSSFFDSSLDDSLLDSFIDPSISDDHLDSLFETDPDYNTPSTHNFFTAYLAHEHDDDHEFPLSDDLDYNARTRVTLVLDSLSNTGSISYNGATYFLTMDELDEIECKRRAGLKMQLGKILLKARDRVEAIEKNIKRSAYHNRRSEAKQWVRYPIGKRPAPPPSPIRRTVTLRRVTVRRAMMNNNNETTRREQDTMEGQAEE